MSTLPKAPLVALSSSIINPLLMSRMQVDSVKSTRQPAGAESGIDSCMRDLHDVLSITEYMQFRTTTKKGDVSYFMVESPDSLETMGLRPVSVMTALIDEENSLSTPKEFDISLLFNVLTLKGKFPGFKGLQVKAQMYLDSSCFLDELEWNREEERSLLDLTKNPAILIGGPKLAQKYRSVPTTGCSGSERIKCLFKNTLTVRVNILVERSLVNVVAGAGAELIALTPLFLPGALKNLHEEIGKIVGEAKETMIQQCISLAADDG